MGVLVSHASPYIGQVSAYACTNTSNSITKGGKQCMITKITNLAVTILIAKGMPSVQTTQQQGSPLNFRHQPKKQKTGKHLSDIQNKNTKLAIFSVTFKRIPFIGFKRSKQITIVPMEA